MQGVVGARLRKARTELRLSQAAFARALGFSSEYISLLEADKRAPSLATLNTIAAYLKKDIRHFLEEKEGAFNILFRSGALQGPEGLDAATRAVLQRFRRYSDDYLRLERLASRRLELAPLYSNISPERLADEERRRLGLGDEPIRDIFALAELNGCRILRLPIPAGARLSGAFLYLEDREAAFALINSADTPGRQAFTAAHEYCHYLKDRHEGPLVESPDGLGDAPFPPAAPREEFAQRFAACFLMSASKVRAIVEKEFGGGRLTYEQALFLKRYFGVSMVAMLRRLTDLGFLKPAQQEDWLKLHPEIREKEVFGEVTEDSRGKKARIGSAIFSDRYRLLQSDAIRMKNEIGDKPRGGQGWKMSSLPD